MIALERPLVGVAQCDYEDEKGSSVSKACHNCLAYLRVGVVYPSPIVKGVYFCTHRDTDCWSSFLKNDHNHFYLTTIERDDSGKIIITMFGKAP